LQVDALTAARVGRIYLDRMTGRRDDRPALVACLAFLRPGDTLVVWRLDRLARSLRHLLDLAADLRARGVNLRSLHENLDTSSATGRLIFHVLGALAEFEADLTRERVMAGLEAARERGRVGGRPRAMIAEKERAAVRLLDQGATAAAIGRAVGVSRATAGRWMRDQLDRRSDQTSE
jgi:DNA invertase Pin-like site-specific DNA recombinase